MGANCIGKIFDEMGAEVLGYLRTIVYDDHYAEDVLQNVFIRLTRAMQTKKNIINMRAYVYTIARNEAFRCLEQKKRQKQESLILLEPKQESAITPAESMALQEALDALPTKQREVLYLKIYGRLTFEEIADCLQISLNTAASRYRYALEKMRKFLGENSEG